METDCSGLLTATQLMGEITKGNGLAGVTLKLSTMLNKNVFITDESFIVLASSTHLLSNKLHVEMLAETIEFEVPTNYFQCMIRWDEVEGLAIGVPIPKLVGRDVEQIANVRRGISGYLFLATESLKKEEQALLQLAVQLCQVEKQKQQKIEAVKSQYQDTFIFDLLYGNIKSDEDIIIQGKLWGINFSHPHTIIVFSLKDFELYSADAQIVNKTAKVIHKQLELQQISALTMEKRDEIVIIFPLPVLNNGKSRLTTETFLSTVFQHVGKTSEHAKERLISGVGRTYQSPSELFRSYQEAKVARELGQLMGITYPFFADLGLVHLLYNHDLQELKAFFEETIGPLRNYDNENESELMDTLNVFFNNQCDLNKSADALFLHRNSLRYRLKKIEEILNINLNDLETRLNIMAALKIKQIKSL